MKLTALQKQTINELKQFYIDHMLEIYGDDTEKFWKDNEDILVLESELKLLED